MRERLPRRATAEFVGTGLLLIAVVGSGVMAERLSGGNVALALLANAMATGAALYALILAFGPVSGAHFNPAVTLADASQGGVGWGDVPVYVLAQCTGALAGGDARARCHQHLRRNPTSGCPRLRPCSAPGSDCSDGPLSVAHTARRSGSGNG